MNSEHRECRIIQNNGSIKSNLRGDEIYKKIHLFFCNYYKNHKILFIVEEGSRGGFSSHCLNIITSSDFLNTNSKIIRTLNLPDLFQEHASQNEQLIEASLDVNGIYNKIKLDIESQKIKLNLKINKGYKNN